MGKFMNIIKWVGVDGLLHFLACYACMLTFFPTLGIWWSSAITISIAICKEIVDSIRYKNTWDMIGHDITCDVAGILASDIVILYWWICSSL